jgi:hypothetical protein
VRVHADAFLDVPLDESGLRHAELVGVLAEPIEGCSSQAGAERLLAFF